MEGFTRSSFWATGCGVVLFGLWFVLVRGGSASPFVGVPIILSLLAFAVGIALAVFALVGKEPRRLAWWALAASVLPLLAVVGFLALLILALRNFT